MERLLDYFYVLLFPFLQELFPEVIGKRDGRAYAPEHINEFRKRLAIRFDPHLGPVVADAYVYFFAYVVHRNKICRGGRT